MSELHLIWHTKLFSYQLTPGTHNRCTQFELLFGSSYKCLLIIVIGVTTQWTVQAICLFRLLRMVLYLHSWPHAFVLLQ